MYPMKVATAPPCSYTLLLMEVEEDPTDFFLVFKKQKKNKNKQKKKNQNKKKKTKKNPPHFLQQTESSGYLPEHVEPKKIRRVASYARYEERL